MKEIKRVKAEYLYDLFFYEYELRKPLIESILNAFSNSLIGLENYLSAVNADYTLLSTEIKELLIKFLLSVSNKYNVAYSNINNLKRLNTIELDTGLLSSIDFFVDKFIKDLSDDLVSELLMSKNIYDSLTKVLNPNDGKGKYHGRLKTMFYMLGIHQVNEIAMRINDVNKKNSFIIDLKNSPTNNLCKSNGVFKVRTSVNLPLWENNNGYKKGKSLPSQFGSKEIIMPKLTRSFALN